MKCLHYKEFSRIYICIIDITCLELYYLNKAQLKKPLILPSLLRIFEFEYDIIFLTRLYTVIPEQLKVGCSFQMLFRFHPFSRKSLFMTAICSSTKMTFSNYFRNRKNCQYRKWSYRILKNCQYREWSYGVVMSWFLLLPSATAN